MVKAVRIHETGGPEVMRLEDIEIDAPGPGMVTVANRAIGLNYIDTYHRSGLYPLPLPIGLGLEGAGILTDLHCQICHCDQDRERTKELSYSPNSIPFHFYIPVF